MKKEAFLVEVNKLMQRHELSKNVTPEYFEPGMMEYLEQNYGRYDKETEHVLLRFEVKGTRYEGRTELIETVKVNDRVCVERDYHNKYKHKKL